MKEMLRCARHLLAGFIVGTLSLVSLSHAAETGKALSPEALAALQNPPDKIDASLRRELESVWRRVAEPALREALVEPDAVIITKLWTARIAGQPYIHFHAFSRTQDRKKRVLVEVFHGAGQKGIELLYGKWFQPATVGEQSIKEVEFAGDRAALSTLTEDGSEALYWRAGEVFIDVRQLEGVKPLAEAVHAAAQKHGIYDFPKPVKVAKAEPKPVRDAGPQDIECKQGDVCREKDTGLPLRVLPRPFSNVHASGGAGSQVAFENIPAFHPLYVFQRRDIDFSSDPAEPKGWYQVGRSTQGAPLGWMRAADLLEWRQALIVAFTHLGEVEEARQPVLMFTKLAQIKELAQSEGVERKAVEIYRQLRRGEVPSGVISKEPETFADITQNFYMFPVIQFEELDLNGEDARFLRVAAAVRGERGSDTLDKPEVRERLTKKEGIPREAAKVLGLDVVFVMDMTASMQPYMDRAKEAVAQLARRIAEKQMADLKEKIRFGLVGYRDDVAKIPALGFTSKNFTPELVEAEALVKILDTEAQAAIAGSKDYPEEVFAGVKMALESTRWNENTLKLIILVGDASSHPVGHEQNTTESDEFALRRTAKDLHIHPMALHLKDPRASRDHAGANQQFETLTRVAGTEGEYALAGIDISKPEDFSKGVAMLARLVADDLRKVRSGGQPPAGETPGGEPGSPEEQVARAFRKVFNAALVEYIGKKTAAPPKDVVAWVIDRDLTDPTVRSLEVRVLINREQLSDLVVALDTVLKAVQKVDITQPKFFEALQAIAAQTSKEPERIAKAKTLADAGLIPAFVKSLPYKSEILSLDDERFGAMTGEQKIGLERRLRAKLTEYRNVHERVDGWVRLNETDPNTKAVYPLNLEALP
ncbi:MAG: vWA domain-containing protein [Nitrospinota bacterium]